MLIRLLGAYAPNTDDGTMLGKPLVASDAAAAPTMADFTNVLREMAGFDLCFMMNTLVLLIANC